MLPGQSAKDPVAENMPGYIDIVGVDSNLDGETLTAIFYLRDIPEELEFNRKGVDNMHLEYMWTIGIKVENGEENESEQIEYTFSAFYGVSRVMAGTPAITRQFKDAIQIELWENQHNNEEGVTYLVDIHVHPRLPVSHEDNSLTLIREIPGITDESTILFSTFDILLGQDGVSCEPG